MEHPVNTPPIVHDMLYIVQGYNTVTDADGSDEPNDEPTPQAAENNPLVFRMRSRKALTGLKQALAAAFADEKMDLLRSAQRVLAPPFYDEGITVTDAGLLKALVDALERTVRLRHVIVDVGGDSRTPDTLLDMVQEALLTGCKNCHAAPARQAEFDRYSGLLLQLCDGERQKEELRGAYEVGLKYNMCEELKVVQQKLCGELEHAYRVLERLENGPGVAHVQERLQEMHISA